MSTFYPVCVTIAFFIALLLFDILEKTPEKFNSHMLLGLITIFLMVYLSFKEMELVSWGLLSFPIVILTISYFLANDKPIGKATELPSSNSSSCSSSSTPAPSISTPEAIATARQIVSENHMCNNS